MPYTFGIWSFVKPVVKWRLESISMSVNVSWELPFKPWNNVVKLKSVSRKMHPSRVSSEQSKSLSWPKTVRLMPAGNIWLSLLHVGPKVIDVEFPNWVS